MPYITRPLRSPTALGEAVNLVVTVKRSLGSFWVRSAPSSQRFAGEETDCSLKNPGFAVMSAQPSSGLAPHCQARPSGPLNSSPETSATDGAVFGMRQVKTGSPRPVLVVSRPITGQPSFQAIGSSQTRRP